MMKIIINSNPHLSVKQIGAYPINYIRIYFTCS